ncbi:MAG: hypothetical protein AAFR52_01685 [Pseudomonadota bacterium]
MSAPSRTPGRVVATVLAGALAAGGAWLAWQGDDTVAGLARDLRRAGWGDLGQVLGVLRWPAVALASILVLTALATPLDRLLQRLAPPEDD